MHVQKLILKQTACRMIAIAEDILGTCTGRIYCKILENTKSDRGAVTPLFLWKGWIYVIEAKVKFHGGNKEVYISQLNGGFDEIANDLVIILDRILVDELIKISPQNMKLSEEEKEKIILTARNQILEKKRDIAFEEKEYIYSEETSLYLTQKYGV